MVKAQVAAVDDLPATGRADQWSGAAETLRRGRGDCEDFALADAADSQASASPTRHVLFMPATWSAGRPRCAGGTFWTGRFLVLDVAMTRCSTHARSLITGTIMSYSANRRWVHGVAYTAPAPQLRIAAAEPTEVQVAAVAF